MACNRALLAQSTPIPVEAIMHDWWLGPVCAGLGDTVFVPRPLVLYRQHQANEIGARSFWSLLIPGKALVRTWQRGNREFRQTLAQARALKNQIGHHLPPDSNQYKALCIYPDLLEGTAFNKIRRARQLKLRQSSWILRGVFYLRLLLLNE